jgi:hypothetical protein
VVTELGGSVPISEARVEARDWMTALALARQAVGESGGVPPGASCSISPDGTVTIHDALARKTYSLAPAKEVAAPPAESAPGPPRAEAGLVGKANPKRAAPKTIAYDARDLGLAPSPTDDPSVLSPKKKLPHTTIAYDARDLQIAPPQPSPAHTHATAAAQTRALPNLGPAPSSTGDRSPPPPKKKLPYTTIAYDARDLQIVPPQPSPAHAPRADAEAQGLASPNEKTRAATQASELLHSRDEEPTETSPLIYRERTYVVPKGTSVAAAEALLLERFEELRQTLAHRPKGKLVDMAIFDHRWSERPDRPPLITLQWKDWHGEPVIHRSGSSEPALRSAAAGADSATTSVAPGPGATRDADLAMADLPPSPGSVDDRLAIALEALQDLFFLKTSIDGLEFIVRLLEDLIPSEATSACLYDLDTGELRFVVVRGPGAAVRQGEAVPRGAGLLGAAMLTPGEPILVEDTRADPRYRESIDGRAGIDPETMVLVSVVHAGRPFAVLQLINRRHQAQFSRADANLLGQIAAKLGEFLHGVSPRADERSGV